MKEITGKVQNKNQSLPTTLETESKIISDKNAILEEFNTFLTYVDSNLVNKIPQCLHNSLNPHLEFEKLLINQLNSTKLLVLMI